MNILKQKNTLAAVLITTLIAFLFIMLGFGQKVAAIDYDAGIRPIPGSSSNTNNTRKSYCERNYGNRSLRSACQTGFSTSENCARRYDTKKYKDACNAGRAAKSSNSNSSRNSSSGGGDTGGGSSSSGGSGGASGGSSSSSSSIPDSEAPETAAVDLPEQEAAIKYKNTKPVNKCGDVATFFKFNCGDTDSSSAENSPIFKVLLFIVNILTTLVGLAAVGGIIAGGIIYSSARDNAEQTKKGITYVVNAVLAILLFAFMFAILNFIIPGGLFT